MDRKNVLTPSESKTLLNQIQVIESDIEFVRQRLNYLDILSDSIGDYVNDFDLSLCYNNMIDRDYFHVRDVFYNLKNILSDIKEKEKWYDENPEALYELFEVSTKRCREVGIIEINWKNNPIIKNGGKK